MPKAKKQRTVARLVLWITLLIGLPLGLMALTWLLTLPDVTLLARTNPGPTALMEHRQAFDRHQRHPVPREWTWVPLSRISRHLQHAAIAAEDASFFIHEGFDWEGIKDAAIHNLEAGELKRGGSTITQQLAKNLYLSPSRNPIRKLRELIIARRLEAELTKTRIFEIYLNVIEWGNGIWGAEAAAHRYFGVSAAALTQSRGRCRGREEA